MASKERTQQVLKKKIVAEATSVLRSAEHAARHDLRHDWLVRHTERQNGRCAFCGIPMILPPRRAKDGRRATLDHVIPLSRSGRDTEANTVAACEACNTAKAHKGAQFFRSSPFLVARKAFAATLSARPVKPIVVTVRKRR